MPITGGGDPLGDAMLAAEDAVRASWLARGRVLSPSDKQQMRREMKRAEAAAMLAFLVANGLVTVVVAGSPGTGGIS